MPSCIERSRADSPGLVWHVGMFWLLLLPGHHRCWMRASPLSTMHPEIPGWIGNKPQILVVNRTDMVSDADMKRLAAAVAHDEAPQLEASRRTSRVRVAVEVEGAGPLPAHVYGSRQDAVAVRGVRGNGDAAPDRCCSVECPTSATEQDDTAGTCSCCCSRDRAARIRARAALGGGPAISGRVSNGGGR